MKLLILVCGLVLCVYSQDLPTYYEYYTGEGTTSGLEVVEPIPGQVGKFTLNRKEFRLLSGAVHYFRVHPAYWRDRLRKVRAAGLNTVETYVPWNLHERYRDQFDFGNGDHEISPFLDIVSFIQMAQEEDLFVLLRPGPYICSEWDYGGLPSWLQRDPDMKVRTSYPGFIERVDIYYRQLLPLVTDLQFTRGGPIIAWQVENEYGHYKNDIDVDYMIFLKEKMIELGADQLFFTSDTPTTAGDSGTVSGAIQSANFKRGAAEQFDLLEELQPGYPKVAMEFWTGWFDHWGGLWHSTSDPAVMEDELNVILIEREGNVNFYMFHGGTSFGFLNGANNLPVFPRYAADVSSYDYDAVLTEQGGYTEKYRIARDTILPLAPFVAHPEMPNDTVTTTYGSVKLTEYLDLDSLLRFVPASHQFLDRSLPLAMEDLPMNGDSGQSFGYILYRNTVQINSTSVLTTVGHVRDLAVLSVDGQLKSEPWVADLQLGGFGFWGARYHDLSPRSGPWHLNIRNHGNWPDNTTTAKTPFDRDIKYHGNCENDVKPWYQIPCNRSYAFNDTEDGEHTLDILVENMGRNNFGVLKDFEQKKGLVEGPVLVDDVELMGWDVFSLEFDGAWIQSISGLLPIDGHIRGPALLRGSLLISISQEIKDTYIEMSGWTASRGVVFVNGFNLGRYSTIGPCRSLYVPAPLLKAGINTFDVFELWEPQMELIFSTAPNYGPPSPLD